MIKWKGIQVVIGVNVEQRIIETVLIIYQEIDILKIIRVDIVSVAVAHTLLNQQVFKFRMQVYKI